MTPRLSLILLLLTPLFTYAQYVSQQGRFRVEERKGCAALQVNIQNTNLLAPTAECGPGKPCDINWGDNTFTQIETNTASHTYTQPGTYTLRILYQNVGTDEITITVTPNLQPAFNMITCGGREVQVRVTDTSYDAYIINYNDGSPEVQVPKGSMAVDNHTFVTAGAKTISVRGKDVNADDNCGSQNSAFQALATLPAPFITELRAESGSQIGLDFNTAPNIVYRIEVAVNNNTSFQVAQTIYNASSATVGGLRTDDNYYCVRVGAYDPCNNVSTYSNIICSANFDATAQNNQNNLTWVTNTTGIFSFTIDRDGTTIAVPVASPYNDVSVICNTSYLYRLTSNYSNGSRSISLIKSATAFSSDIPTAINNITAVVGSSGVNLSWPQDPAFQAVEYSIFRKSSTTQYQRINTSAQPSFQDNTYNSEENFCYYVTYVDDCNNTSIGGIEACPIVLTGSLTTDNYNQLDWSGYTGWINGVTQYVLEKYSEQGQLLQSYTFNSSTTSFLDNEIDPAEQVYRYIIVANANSPGLGQAVSNEIVLVKEPKLYFPTAFTPDKQGPVQNEVFKVFGQYITKFEMRIFNRWGELLFVSTDLSIGWDGTYKGKEQPEGTYAFTASLTDLAGRNFIRTGSVVLLRKR